MTDVITGQDGQIRGAVLKVSTNRRLSTFCRLISSLYPLEVMPEPNNNQRLFPVKRMTTRRHDSMLSARPVRAAAESVQQQLHKWMTELTDDSNK